MQVPGTILKHALFTSDHNDIYCEVSDELVADKKTGTNKKITCYCEAYFGYIY